MSLVEPRRENGKVRHEHVSSLGSVETPLTVAGRIEFWGRLHERLARLSNRLDSETQSKVLGAVHARVPMPTADEQRGLQLENAKTDADQWEWIHGTHAAMVQDHKGLAAMVADKIAEGETCAAEAAAKAKVARERVEGIERGENVEGGLGEPLDAKNVEKILRAAGYTTSGMQEYWPNCQKSRSKSSPRLGWLPLSVPNDALRARCCLHSDRSRARMIPTRLSATSLGRPFAEPLLISKAPRGLRCASPKPKGGTPLF